MMDRLKCCRHGRDVLQELMNMPCIANQVQDISFETCLQPMDRKELGYCRHGPDVLQGDGQALQRLVKRPQRGTSRRTPS